MREIQNFRDVIGNIDCVIHVFAFGRSQNCVLPDTASRLGWLAAKSSH